MSKLVVKLCYYEVHTEEAICIESVFHTYAAPCNLIIGSIDKQSRSLISPSAIHDIVFQLTEGYLPPLLLCMNGRDGHSWRHCCCKR